MKMGILDGDVNHSNRRWLGPITQTEIMLIAILIKREIKFSTNSFSSVGRAPVL